MNPERKHRTVFPNPCCVDCLKEIPDLDDGVESALSVKQFYNERCTGTPSRDRVAAMDKPLAKAEEVFLIVRELCAAKQGRWGGHFNWKLWFEACKAVHAPTDFQLRNGFKQTVGNMLRAQVKAGTLVRTQRGKYSFSDHGRPVGNWMQIQAAKPLYVMPGSFCMAPDVRRRNIEARRPKPAPALEVRPPPPCL